MKHAVILLSLLTCACHSLSIDRDAVQALENEVRGRFDSLVSAAQSLNTDVYFEHFDHEKFTSLNQDGTITPAFDIFQRDFLKGIEGVRRYRSLEFANVDVSIIDANTAILINEYVATIELKTGRVIDVAGAGNQVWHKSLGTWRLVSVSSSTK